MFIISQLLISNTNICTEDKVPSYSIIIGVVLYASIYLYALMYNQQLMTLLSKFLIYIICVDLLISAFYHYKLNKDKKHTHNKQDNEVQDNLLTSINNMNNIFNLEHIKECGHEGDLNQEYSNDNSTDSEDSDESVHSEDSQESVLTNISIELPNQNKIEELPENQTELQSDLNDNLDLQTDLEGNLQEDLKKQLELMNQDYIKSMEFDSTEIQKKKRGRKPKIESQASL